MLHLLRRVVGTRAFAGQTLHHPDRHNSTALVTTAARFPLTHRGECCIRCNSARFVGVQLLAQDVLRRPVRGDADAVLVALAAQHDQHLAQAELAGGGIAVKPGHELVAMAAVAPTRGLHDERDEDPLQRNRRGERLDVGLVELADVLADLDELKRDPTRARGSAGHDQPFRSLAPPGAGPIPSPPHAAGVRTLGGVGPHRARSPPAPRARGACGSVRSPGDPVGLFHAMWSMR
jgi:hypothetical protein